MKFLVAYNGSQLSEDALERAKRFSDEGDEVVVVTVVPRNPNDAEDALEFSSNEYDDVVGEAGARVSEILPDASFVPVDIGRPVSPGRVGQLVRSVADERDADVVFVGSMKAGRIVSSITSPATQIVTDTAYDVLIVRDGDG